MNINVTVGIDETPTLPQLMKFGERHLNIIQEIGNKYRKFGIRLLEDVTGDKMETIEMRAHGDVEAINLTILMIWMKGEGRKPTNWATLATVLKECDFIVLADEICYMMAKPGTSRT